MIDTLRLRHTFIPLFCLWHMFAVSAYVIPISRPGGMGSIGQTLHDVSAPYVLALSQWQQWNLFAPDPIRRVSLYSIDMDVGNQWIPTPLVDPTTRPFYEYAKLMKVLGRLETTHHSLVNSFLLYECRNLEGSDNHRLRLRIDVFNLPSNLIDLRQRRGTSPTTSQRIAGTVLCPSSQHQ